ncbi:4934_t:CDS:2 [Ambispora gerdemannii]|uniref:4934_t:CDS:1 n=1 Tax=Ambispora gerdemannii TaxID=144530 RepID=A0A9N9ANX7_9GLOM|nr:4934_t:CDS:2 [Ambispora gerdemannii]
MKLITKEEEKEHYDYTIRQGLQKGLIGLGAGLGLSFIGHKYSRNFRSLTLPLKAFLVSSFTTAVFIVAAEKASIDFERKKYGEYDERSVRNDNYVTISREDAVKIWLNKHKWPIVVGTWGLAMVGSMASLYRNKYLTTSQKLVQARMYAQGVTIIVVLAAAAFSVNTSKEPHGFQEWKNMVNEEERRMNKVSSSSS